MFEDIPSSSPQILHLGTNILKGGDFMERVQDDRHPSTHPLRKGRIKPEPLEIAVMTDLKGEPLLDPTGQPMIDPVVFASVSRMDGGE